MLIYFQTFTYQDHQEQSHPLLWEYSPTENIAKCIYQVVGNSTKVDPEVVNESLKKINGIKISDGVAILVDCSLLEKEICAYVEPSKPTLRGVLLSPAFFTPAPNSNFSAKLLSFDSLLSGSEGSTLCYEVILRNNNDANLAKLTALKIHSQTSANLAIQVIKNIDFYYLRQIQIKLVRHLYEDIFASSLSAVRPEEVPSKAVDYFRQAIIAIMENTKYNSIDTAFEKAQAEDKEPIPIEDNYKIRVIYARRMLAAFLFFIEDTVPPVKIPTSAEEADELRKLKIWLPVFKDHIQKHKEKLALLLNDLEQLIICTGLMQHDNSQLTFDALLHNGNLDFSLLTTKLKALQVDMERSTMAVAVKKLNSAHKIPSDLISAPEKIYSLKSLVHDWFKKALHEDIQSEFKESEINAHVENIVQQLVTEICGCTKGFSRSEEAKWISHTMTSSDTDVYVTREWEMNLEAEFSKLKTKLTITKSKHASHLEADIVKFVTSFIHQQLEQLKHQNQTTDAPKTTEMTL
ncbi:hypothetical protein [Legionella maioricensis]|uniref:Uncharacterized protein n=1 Tax=Legionella maioricensis TaxID=2896528 RepID=A0A9X2D2U6_9GAMM|nr:hypothetical protein [Legionella maioricensis]MCL9685035.1 hypothetical protein [Legionella maioricensis]MCL9688068.1 hypothetical protein [Legionella maioricensis]